MREKQDHRTTGPLDHRKNIIFYCILVFLLCFQVSACYAQQVSSTDLIEKANEYNNRIIEYKGEVIGDVMVRGDFAWVNLNDGAYAIGVWGKKDLITSIVKNKGGYKAKGDILLVKGVFHKACPHHGGDLDIHIEKAEKLTNGFLIPHRVGTAKVINFIGLSIVAAGLAVLCWFKSYAR